MRRTKTLLISVLSFGLLAACGTTTQTFINKDDPSRSLSLTHTAGFVRPAAEFPRNVLFKLFGTEKLEGTYVLVNGRENIKGKFVASNDGDSQSIKFSSDGNPEWKVKVVGGDLVEPDGATWSLESARAESKSVSTVKIGE